MSNSIETSKSKAEQRFVHAFQQLNAVLYRQPTETEKKWLQRNALAESTPIYRNQSREVRTNIELKQRALSYIEAVWKVAFITIADDTKLHEIQEKLFVKFKDIQEKINNWGSALNAPEIFATFLKQEMEASLIEELKQFLIDELGVSAKKASKVLNQFEAIANWERQAQPEQRNGFAVITGEVVRVSRPIELKLTDAQKAEFEKIRQNLGPVWFQKLPSATQEWLRQNADRIIENKLPCPPSVLRFIPGLANVREDLVLITNQDGVVTNKSSTIRMAVPTPVDISDETEKQRITELNVAQAVELLEDKDHLKNFFGLSDQNIDKLKPFALFQRLLSPVGFVDNLGLSGSDNNTVFLEGTRAAIQKNSTGKKIHSPNWPINAAQNLAANPFKDKENQATRKSLNEFALGLLKALNSAGKLYFISNTTQWLAMLTRLNANDLGVLSGILKPGIINFDDPIKAQQFKLAIAALQQYEMLWEQYETKGEVPNPHGVNVHLRMAALEMIIAEGLGLQASSGCKSAKDREAVLNMEMTAIKRFFAKENCVPSIFQADNVKRVADYFAEEYISNYHQEVVSFGNSLGDSAIQKGEGPMSLLEACGIEIPQMIPAIYSEKIGEKLEKNTRNPGKVAEDEINRQDKYGKSATWGKVATGLKKVWLVLKEWFGAISKPLIQPTGKSIILAQTSGDVLLPDCSIYKCEKTYISGTEPKTPVPVVSRLQEKTEETEDLSKTVKHAVVNIADNPVDMPTVNQEPKKPVIQDLPDMSAPSSTPTP